MGLSSPQSSTRHCSWGRRGSSEDPTACCTACATLALWGRGPAGVAPAPAPEPAPVPELGPACPLPCCSLSACGPVWLWPGWLGADGPALSPPACALIPALSAPAPAGGPFQAGPLLPARMASVSETWWKKSGRRSRSKPGQARGCGWKGGSAEASCRAGMGRENT